MAKVRAIHESGYAREEGDLYPAPARVTECLLHSVTLRGPIREPCCGDGALARFLAAAGHEDVSTDLVDRGRAATTAQHHHDWISLDFALPGALRPTLSFAHRSGGERSAHTQRGQATLPLFGPPDTDTDH
ncbi:MAG: hypothetical protein KIS73_16790 [Enhydrobacter sp.]|nr:hypothetical protein [Enhydrobacter sp.]